MKQAGRDGQPASFIPKMKSDKKIGGHHTSFPFALPRDVK
jgi:hypothetical protein